MIVPLQVKDHFFTDIQVRNKVHIWQACLDVNASQIKNFLKTLTQDEQIRANRYMFTVDRQRFIAARGILRSLLAHYLNTSSDKIVFKYGLAGKPEIAHPTTSLKFNLSHSSSTALYAFSWGSALGIDIEVSQHRFSLESLTSSVFSVQEQTQLSAYPAQQRIDAFLRGWTRKEAFLKATGAGLSFPLLSIEVPFEKDIKDVLIGVKYDMGLKNHSRLYSFESFSRHAAALVIIGDPATITFNRWPDLTSSLQTH